MHFTPCPKPTRKPKKRRAIQRRSRFREETNIFKNYRHKRGNAAVMAFAEFCRSRRLDNSTPAEDAFAGILRELAVEFEREHIVYYANGSRFIIIDFFIAKGNWAIEIDGSSHQRQVKYDVSRDSYLARQGIRTVRFENKTVLQDPAAVAERLREVLG